MALPTLTWHVALPLGNVVVVVVGNAVVVVVAFALDCVVVVVVVMVVTPSMRQGVSVAAPADGGAPSGSQALSIDQANWVMPGAGGTPLMDAGDTVAPPPSALSWLPMQ